MKPTQKAVAATLDAIEAAEREPDHPRSIARAAIRKFRSNAQKLKLGVSNQQDSGAPSLRTDEVLSHAAYDARLGRK